MVGLTEMADGQMNDTTGGGIWHWMRRILRFLFGELVLMIQLNCRVR